MQLTALQSKVRLLLIRVAQGEPLGERVGLISYKELWSRLSNSPWGRGNSQKIVAFITAISGFELEQGRPPLNELVVPKNKPKPSQSWMGIRRHLKKTFAVDAPYNSHREAQEACWRYWVTHRVDQKVKIKPISNEVTPEEAEEGFSRDRTVTFRSRNARLVKLCKKRDKNRCRVCGFRLKVSGRFVIDCHHINQLAHHTEAKVTALSDLVCLCPTCHRVAHTSRYPLSVDEIRVARKM
jgi:predicted HNH restriction endonuclease